MTYNNPKIAEEFIKIIAKLTKILMTDIKGFNQYKREEAHMNFINDYTKTLKKLDQYFKNADPKVVIELIDDWMCSLLHEPEPDAEAMKIHQSEEKVPTGHSVLTQLAHEMQPTPLSDKAQAAVETLFENL